MSDAKKRPIRCFPQVRNTAELSKRTIIMTPLILAYTPVLAAAGWAFLTYIFGGGAGLAIVVFIVLKMFGK